MTDKIQSQIRQLLEYKDTLGGGQGAKSLMPILREASGGESGKPGTLWKLSYDDIYVMPGQNPRIVTPDFTAKLRGLAEQIAANGFYEDKPLSAYVAEVDGVQRVVLQDGHRRHAAGKIAMDELGAPKFLFPVVLKDKSTNEVDRLTAILQANEQGEKFTLAEKAIVAARFRNFGTPVAEIAKRMGVTVAAVDQFLTLAGAPKDIRDAVANGEISGTYAIQTIQQHGAEASKVIGEAKAVAASTGKKATASKGKKAQLLSRQKRFGPELCVLILKGLEAKQITTKGEVGEELEKLLDRIEFGTKPAKPVKEPKPKKAAAKKAPAKKAVAKKVPLAKKIARKVKV